MIIASLDVGELLADDRLECIFELVLHLTHLRRHQVAQVVLELAAPQHLLARNESDKVLSVGFGNVCRISFAFVVDGLVLCNCLVAQFNESCELLVEVDFVRATHDGHKFGGLRKSG